MSENINKPTTHVGVQEPQEKRKGKKVVPQKFLDILERVKSTVVPMKKEVEKTAIQYVPEPYWSLREYGFRIWEARNTVINYTVFENKLWLLQTVRDEFPKEAKDEVMRRLGIRSGKMRTQKIEQKIEEVIERFPSLKDASPKEQKMASKLSPYISTSEIRVTIHEIRTIYEKLLAEHLEECIIVAKDGRFDHIKDIELLTQQIQHNNPNN
jgi:uncharacterized protein YqgV (UPF0045/DUF77 family)